MLDRDDAAADGSGDAGADPAVDGASDDDLESGFTSGFDDADDDGERIVLEHPNGWAAYDTVERFLEIDGWFPTPIDGTTAYKCGFNGESAKFRVIAHVNVELEQLYLYVIADVNVPEETRDVVSEFVCRSNYGMRIGNFEIDVTDGEIRYKSSLDFEGEVLTHQLIRNAIYPAATTIDRYFPALMRVAFGGATAADAVAEVEGRQQPPPAES